MPGEKGIAQILVLVFLITGIGFGTYLVQQRTNFLPQAKHKEVGFCSKGVKSFTLGEICKKKTTYKGATYTCFDDYSSTLGNGEDCKTKKYWENQAKTECKKHPFCEKPSPSPSPSISPSPSPLPLVLSDDFSGPSLDTSLWEVFDNGGTYHFDNGSLIIPGGGAVPFFRAKNNPFLTSGTFTVEFGIQYLTQKGGGDGVGVSFVQQANISNANMWPNNPLAFWQDPVGFRIVSYGSNALTIAASDFNYHIVKISYDGQKYMVFLDSSLIYTSTNTAIAGGLWFGHPSYCCPTNEQWTGFKLDYIKVI